MNDGQILVGIGIPSGDMVHADFAMHLATLCLNPGAKTFLINAKSSLVVVGRNQLVAAAQKVGATHLLFIDSDMVFPHDTLARLLKHNKDVVGASCSRRTAPFYPLGITWEGEVKHLTTGLHRMKIMPTGVLMVRMAVFEKLPKPWFNTRAEGEQILGEDYYFSEHATAAGFQLWCDGDLSREIGHVGQKTFYIDEKQ